MDLKKPIEIFTALDLELNQPSGKIIQIGAVTGNIYTGEILERLSVYVNPKEEIATFITELTKIKQEDVDSGLTLEEAYRLLEEMHKSHQAFCNPITWGGGDSVELINQLKQENPSFQGWCFGRRWIDTKTLYVTWRLANQKPPTGGLSRAMANLGLQFRGQAHNAIWDAENTFYTYCKIVEIMKSAAIKGKVRNHSLKIKT
jgi:inhibitor of KinA sporulation pathway (predicted exonuclease)